MIQYWTRKKNRTSLQATGALVAACFLFSSIAAPFAQASIWNERKQAADTQKKSAEPVQLASAAGTPASLAAQTHESLAARKIGVDLTRDMGGGVSQDMIRSILLKKQAETAQAERKRSGVPQWFWDKVSAYGEIESVYLLPGQDLRLDGGAIRASKPLVVHIQDVHNLVGVQKNIAFLVRELTRSGVAVVGIEGSAGKLKAMEQWRRYPDKKSLMGVAGYLLDQGLLTGAEAAGLERENPAVDFYGVEDKDSYLQQVDAFKGTLNVSRDAANWQLSKQPLLGRLKKKIYDSGLADLDASQQAYDRGELKLGDWLEALGRKAGRPAATPNLALFLKARAIEKGLDFNIVKAEQSRVLQNLSGNLGKAELIELLESSLLYRLGRIQNSEFYASLRRLCAKAGVEVTPGLSKYIAYVLDADKIDPKGLIKEARRFEAQTWAGLLKGRDQSNLRRLDEDFRLIGKGVDFTLSPEEWDDFKARKGELLRFSARLNELAAGFGISDHEPRRQTVALKNMLEGVSRFNQLSEKRNDIFFSNLTGRMGKDRTAAILVAGGYHTRGIEERLKAGGVSFITLKPRINFDEIKNAGSPLEAFSRDPLPLEQAFLPEKVSLAVQQGLGGVEPETPLGTAVKGLMSSVLPVLTAGSPAELEAGTFLSAIGTDAQVGKPEESLGSRAVPVVVHGRQFRIILAQSLDTIKSQAGVIASGVLHPPFQSPTKGDMAFALVTVQNRWSSLTARGRELFQNYARPAFQPLIIGTAWTAVAAILIYSAMGTSSWAALLPYMLLLVPANSALYEYSVGESVPARANKSSGILGVSGWLSNRLADVIPDFKKRALTISAIETLSILWIVPQLLAPPLAAFLPIDPSALTLVLQLSMYPLLFHGWGPIYGWNVDHPENRLTAESRIRLLTKLFFLGIVFHLIVPATLTGASGILARPLVDLLQNVGWMEASNSPMDYANAVDYAWDTMAKFAIPGAILFHSWIYNWLIAPRFSWLMGVSGLIGPLAGKLVMPFELLHKEDTEVAGGKGANLGQMVNDGQAIPPGFVITAKAYQDTLHDPRNVAKIERMRAILDAVDVDDAEALGEAAEEIKAIISSLVIPEELELSTLEAFEILAQKAGMDADEVEVAVRSSATQEDKEIPEAIKPLLSKMITSGSSAGQQSTYLNVRRDTLMAHILEDYASLYNSNAISYRDTQGLLDFLIDLSLNSQLLGLGQAFADYRPQVPQEATAEQRRAAAAEAQRIHDLGTALKDLQNNSVTISRVQLRYMIRKVLPEGNQKDDILAKMEKAYDPYINPESLSLAVVVQKMVQSEVSFVVFSVDPPSGWTGLSFQGDTNKARAKEGRVFRIDTNYGLGESVVQGKVNPDSFLVHIFKDERGEEHVNILEKTIGTKRLKAVKLSEGLRVVGVTENQIKTVVALFRAWKQKGDAALADPVHDLDLKLTSKLFEALQQIIETPIDQVEGYAVPEHLLHTGLNSMQLITLAHMVQKLVEDPSEKSFFTFIPAAHGNRFAASDDTIKDIARAAKKAADPYQGIRDMEGGIENGTVYMVQSRGFTTPTEVDNPGILEQYNTVVDPVAAAGTDVLAAGVKGRRAAVGEIFFLDKSDTSEPYDAKLKRAQDLASRLRAEGKFLILVSQYTYPEDVPAMKVAAGLVALEGGGTSHAAIVSRELKVAAVVGISDSLDGLRKDDPAAYQRVMELLRTNGNTITVDANNGRIYEGAIPLHTETIVIDPYRLPRTRFTKPGLIAANPAAMREISKVSLYDSYYGVSLARAEFIIASIGIHPRAIEAYDYWVAMQIQPDELESLRTEDPARYGVMTGTLIQLEHFQRTNPEVYSRILRDVDALAKNPKVIAKIEDKVRGYPSAKEYYIDNMRQGIASMAAANGLDKKILYRFNDFKQNELGEIIGGTTDDGHDLFGLHEEASMIGDRGTGWLVKEENRASMDMEMEALKRAYEDGYHNLGAFLAFVRTPEELKKGLERFEEFGLPLETLGMMVELPANVVQAEEFGEILADFASRNEKHTFFSFGTNDLTQLTLQAGREETAVKDLFRESHPSVIGSINHVARVAAQMREKYGVDFTCGLCGQAIVNLIDSYPEAARQIVPMLDSTGLDIMAFMKAVRLISESELESSILPQESVKGARLVAHGRSSRTQGAASRRVTVVRGFADLADVYLGDFMVIDPSGDAFDLNRIPDLDLKSLIDQVDRESFDPELKAMGKKLRQSLAGDEKPPRDDLGKFLVRAAVDRAGAVVWRTAQPEGGIEILARRGTAAFPIRIEGNKPYLADTGSGLVDDLEQLHGTIVTVDFASGRVYDGERELLKPLPHGEDPVQVVENPEHPVEKAAAFVSAADVYRSMDQHPLYDLERGNSDPLIQAVRNAVTNALPQARKTGILVYRTSDMSSADYRRLGLGEDYAAHEENPPLGLGGLYRFVKDERYRLLLRHELDILNSMRSSPQMRVSLVIELTDVRDMAHIQLVRDLMNEVGMEGVKISVRMDNPDNYLRADQYMRVYGLDFVSISPHHLSKSYLAADRDNPAVPITDEDAAKNLRLPINMVLQAATDAGVPLLHEGEPDEITFVGVTGSWSDNPIYKRWIGWLETPLTLLVGGALAAPLYALPHLYQGRWSGILRGNFRAFLSPNWGALFNREVMLLTLGTFGVSMLQGTEVFPVAAAVLTTFHIWVNRRATEGLAGMVEPSNRDLAAKIIRTMAYQTPQELDASRLALAEEILSARVDPRLAHVSQGPWDLKPLFEILGMLHALQEDDAASLARIRQALLSFRSTYQAEIVPVKEGILSARFEVGRKVREGDMGFARNLLRLGGFAFQAESALSPYLAQDISNAFNNGYALVRTVTQRDIRDINGNPSATQVMDLSAFFDPDALADRKAWMLQAVRNRLNDAKAGDKTVFVAKGRTPEKVRELLSTFVPDLNVLAAGKQVLFLEGPESGGKLSADVLYEQLLSMNWTGPAVQVNTVSPQFWLPSERYTSSMIILSLINANQGMVVRALESVFEGVKSAAVLIIQA